MTAQFHTTAMQGLSLPMQLADGTVAIVRRLSPSMLYVELDATRSLQGPLVLEMRMPQAQARFLAEARIVSVIQLGPVCGIEMRLVNLRLHPSPESGARRMAAVSRPS